MFFSMLNVCGLGLQVLQISGSPTSDPKMDDYMFKSYVTECKCVQEATSYLEIFNYSVSAPFLCSGARPEPVRGRRGPSDDNVEAKAAAKEQDVVMARS